MKKEFNKIRLFGKTAIYSTSLLILVILLSSIVSKSDPNHWIYYLLIPLVIGVGLTFTVSLYGFIILTIYHQFKDKMIFWAIISILLLIIHLADNYGTTGTSVGLILIVSCITYYFVYIRPKFKVKGK